MHRTHAALHTERSAQDQAIWNKIFEDYSGLLSSFISWRKLRPDSPRKRRIEAALFMIIKQGAAVSSFLDRYEQKELVALAIVCAARSRGDADQETSRATAEVSEWLLSLSSRMAKRTFHPNRIKLNFVSKESAAECVTALFKNYGHLADPLS